MWYSSTHKIVKFIHIRTPCYTSGRLPISELLRLVAAYKGERLGWQVFLKGNGFDLESSE